MSSNPKGPRSPHIEVQQFKLRRHHMLPLNSYSDHIIPKIVFSKIDISQNFQLFGLGGGKPAVQSGIANEMLSEANKRNALAHALMTQADPDHSNSFAPPDETEIEVARSLAEEDLAVLTDLTVKERIFIGRTVLEVQSAILGVVADATRAEPPRFAEVIIQALLTDKRREVMLGDLDESFANDCAAFGVDRARRRYLGNVLYSLRPLIWRLIKRTRIIALWKIFLG